MFVNKKIQIENKLDLGEAFPLNNNRMEWLIATKQCNDSPLEILMKYPHHLHGRLLFCTWSFFYNESSLLE